MNNIIVNENIKDITLIFSHGLGDNSSSWLFFANELKKHINNIKIILADSPIDTVCVNNNSKMKSWFNIINLPISKNSNENYDNIDKSVKIIHDIVENEINNGQDPKKIFIGGFSQGASLSLISGLSYYNQELGGIIMFSGWILKKPFSRIKNINKNTPIFIGHGTKDNTVLYENAISTDDFLKSNKIFNVKFNTYENMGHNTSTNEVYDIIDWIKYLTKKI
mgnify:CR=1 FL=1|tara:strand:- start:269 stop:934 length:666 start_codon:yes stop_codon:yes gene_type:complete